jgi:hypothetical protein
MMVGQRMLFKPEQPDLIGRAVLVRDMSREGLAFFDHPG